jgi:D-arabinose 1-dehydrogenase-like Zn-dependent alcohol dehydrogenase
MGYEVVVFSGSVSKEEKARKFGAKFVAMKLSDTLDIKPINHPLVTAAVSLDEQPNPFLFT